MNLWCAIYSPHFGNYYHWAFAVSDETNGAWHVFEVVQDEQDGPFRPNYVQTNPANSGRCQQPLTFLGRIDARWWSTLTTSIATQQIGEALSWNCQDYVLEIWEIVHTSGMITQGTWEFGKGQMLPYYGQDFGGQYDEEDGEDEENREGEEDDENHEHDDAFREEQHTLSAEYIDNSSDE